MLDNLGDIKGKMTKENFFLEWSMLQETPTEFLPGKKCPIPALVTCTGAVVTSFSHHGGSGNDKVVNMIIQLPCFIAHFNEGRNWLLTKLLTKIYERLQHDTSTQTD